jgi:hypothetical protein
MFLDETIADFFNNGDFVAIFKCRRKYIFVFLVLKCSLQQSKISLASDLLLSIVFILIWVSCSEYLHIGVSPFSTFLFLKLDRVFLEVEIINFYCGFLRLVTDQSIAS